MGRVLQLRRNGDVASLHVPKEVASVIPQNMAFTISMTEDGILFKPVKVDETPQVELPDWLKPAE